MKAIVTRQSIIFYGLQVAVWLVFLMVPAISAFIATHSWSGFFDAFTINARIHWASAAIYFVNTFILVPWGYYHNRRWLFWTVNALILGWMTYIWFFRFDSQTFMEHVPDQRFSQYALSSYYASALVAIFMSAALAGIALLAHHVYRAQAIKRQLKEEQQKRTEAELEWLKNQLNPHFLFNTLNNISSLIQIEPDTAQDAIAQLSDLLRYAMYETRHETVPLQGEVEFMRNYVELMKLRHNERLKLSTKWPDTPPSNLRLPPLLFISLIENAFKHGVSSSRDSMVSISLTADNDRISFSCTNTNYPKDEQNRSGSGIGIENTRRRLDLMYPGRYTWDYGVNDDGTEYHSCITINFKL